MEQNKFFCNAAAALAYLFRKQRDAVGLSLFSDRLEVHTPAKSSLAHHRFIYAELEKTLFDYEPSNQKSTTVAETLHEIAENIPRRSLVCIFSDMLTSENSDQIFQLCNIASCEARGNCFSCSRRRKGANLDFENRPYTFVDMESGESIKLNPNQYKEKFKEMAETKKRALQLKCGQYMIILLIAIYNPGITIFYFSI